MIVSGTTATTKKNRFVFFFEFYSFSSKIQELQNKYPPQHETTSPIRYKYQFISQTKEKNLQKKTNRKEKYKKKYKLLHGCPR
jgi:hypothetical protein